MFSLRKQAGGQPFRGACEEGRGFAPAAGGDQLTARSDRRPAGSLQRGEIERDARAATNVSSCEGSYYGEPHLTFAALSFQLTHENEELNQNLSSSRETQLRLQSEARHLGTIYAVHFGSLLFHFADATR